MNNNLRSRPGHIASIKMARQDKSRSEAGHSRVLKIKVPATPPDSKPISATISKKTVKMTRCSDHERNVHSCSYGTVLNNLVISSNDGKSIVMTHDEALVMFAVMQKDDRVSGLFSRSEI